MIFTHVVLNDLMSSQHALDRLLNLYVGRSDVTPSCWPCLMSPTGPTPMGLEPIAIIIS
jgi:hypothetical protein